MWRDVSRRETAPTGFRLVSDWGAFLQPSDTSVETPCAQLQAVGRRTAAERVSILCRWLICCPRAL